MFAGPKPGLTAGRSPVFRSAEQLNSRVVELTPATPRADVACRHLWFIKNKTVADKYRGRFSWNGFVG
jgi:hypothetical protein